MNNEMLKLKSSLCDAIKIWADGASQSDGWADLDTYFSHDVYDLMADSAFNIMLAQSDLSKYLRSENITEI